MKNVLYVEDSFASQALMRRFLKEVCFVSLAPTQAGALTLLKEQKYDLVITDFLFPEGDALDLILHIRELGGPMELPIIVVSSSMDRALTSRVLRAGANEALCKPLDPRAFRHLVERMMVEPSVRPVENEVLRVSCMQWKSKQGFHQHCPELGLTVTGISKDEVAQKMQAALQTNGRQGSDLGATSQESIVTHLLEF